MSIRDSLRVIAAEKRIEELGAEIDGLDEAVELLNKRLDELNEKLDAMLAVAVQPRPVTQGPPRPPERR